MLWFQPGALEPLHKFELLGLLTSLAVYNGLTLPVTFPLALYRKLLDLPVTKLEHIEDGWPSLMRGLKSLLNYEDDSGRTRVEDVFMRSYIFSVETLGTTISVDMEKIGREDDWHSVQGSKLVCERAVPQSRSESKAEMLSSMSKNDLNVFQSSADGSDGLDLQETLNGMSSTPGIRKALRTRTDSITSQARMVTELNRNQYVEDYIFWLTDKSIRPQYEAFARGFYVCLDRKATTILSPELLKRMVEGTQEIDVDALQEGARYEGGYSSEHPVIKDFWHVVHELPEESVRRLLEFVTASDRIPVNGIRNIQFIIQRNGNDDHVCNHITVFLPSSTCC